tara:strand:+ start:208 stop:849 length:642 start_codon:yes stop_codon:yes gene_type:complete
MNGGLFGGVGGVGPALEYVSTFTVATTNSIILEITGLPTTYRDVLVVADNMILNSSGGSPYVLMKHSGSSDNPIPSNAAGMWDRGNGYSSNQQFVKQGITAGTVNMPLMKGPSGVTDISGGTSLQCWASWLICDSSDATVGKTLRAYTDGTQFISNFPGYGGGTIVNEIVGFGFDEVVTSLRFDAKGASGGTTSNYYWRAGSQFHIYGIGLKN